MSLLHMKSVSVETGWGSEAGRGCEACVPGIWQGGIVTQLAVGWDWWGWAIKCSLHKWEGGLPHAWQTSFSDFQKEYRFFFNVALLFTKNSKNLAMLHSISCHIMHIMSKYAHHVILKVMLKPQWCSVHRKWMGQEGWRIQVPGRNNF
jgi:hypothetical protein